MPELHDQMAALIGMVERQAEASRRQEKQIKRLHDIITQQAEATHMWPGTHPFASCEDVRY